VRKVLGVGSLLVLGASLSVILAACGDDAVSLGPPPRQTVTSTNLTTTLPGKSTFEVWFASGERLVRTQRTHEQTRAVATAAVNALLAGPTRVEQASGISSAIPLGTRLLGVSVRNGVGTVDLTSEFESGGGSLWMQMRLGQVVYTLTQFQTVKAVRFELDGRPVNVFSGEGIVLDHPVGRSDYKDLAPSGAPVTGRWRVLPAAPIPAPDLALSVWTGTDMIVFGRVITRGAHGEILKTRAVAAAYDPAAGSWRQLAKPLSGPPIGGRSNAFWTGKEMLVWGDVNQALDPDADEWRRLPPAPAGRGGLVVWTGRELIEWGGGCCGDVSGDGGAYNPETDSWRKLPPAPVRGQQTPVGAWTGKELVIFPGVDPEDKPVAGAAYNPATNSWRRLPSFPAPPHDANAVWDGQEVLVAGGTRTGGGLTAIGLAFDPQSNGWRRLPPMDSGRTGAAAVWTGRRLLVWGGQTFPGGSVYARHGLTYDPIGNRWSPLPDAPIPGRTDPTGVWTGHELIVWGGGMVTCRRNGPCSTRLLADGAAFSPATP
jgi:hypothetical protein